MSTPAHVDLLYAVAFDNPVFVEPDVLGVIDTIKLPSSTARLEWPQSPSDGESERALLKPPSAHPSFGNHLPSDWGVRRKGSPEIEAHAALLVVPIITKLTFDLQADQIGGAGVRQMLEEVSRWFQYWLWIITAQSLEAVYPDPKTLHRASNQLIIAASSGGKFSWPSSGSPPLVASFHSGDATSERVTNLQVVQVAAKKANGPSAPLILELLAAARSAGRRGDTRRAMVDLGTVAEVAITRALGLPPDHKQTLGGLVTTAFSRNSVPIPADIRAALVIPRNEAVHRGVTPTRPQLCRAIDIAEQLAVLVEPDLIPVSTLRAVNRPQRHDITFIQGPRRTTGQDAGAPELSSE